MKKAAWIVALTVVTVASAATLTADITAPAARKAAPAFSLKDASGAAVKLANYKGKIVLLNFWATWCGPCKLEIPWFVEFQSKYKADGLEVLGVSVDEKGWKAVKPYLDEHHKDMNYAIAIADDRMVDQYKVSVMPRTVLIDRDGKIAVIHEGLVDKSGIENEIKTLLDQK